jgi:cell division protein FtsW
MTASTTIIGDRRDAALHRAQAMGRHPSRRPEAVRSASPSPAFYIIAVTATVLTLLGLVMVLSATSISEVHKGNSPFRVFNRQVVWALLGALGLVVAKNTPTRRWRTFAMPAFVATTVLMLLPFVPHVGASVNGARSWVAVGPLTFQPSEFMKLALLVVVASVMADRQHEADPAARGLVRVLLLTAIACCICLVQGDLGSAIVLAVVGISVAFVAGAPLLPLGVVGAAGVFGAMALAFTSGRRRNRFVAFLDCEANSHDLCYQTYQAMIATAQGGITGSGVGQGHSKLGELVPLAHSDFVFAVVAEELGIIGVVAVLGGFLALAYAGVQVALASSSHFHRLLAGGIVGWFVVQALINVGGVTGLLPVTGLTLPFISAGGSSLFVTLVATGILLNLARNDR